MASLQESLADCKMSLEIGFVEETDCSINSPFPSKVGGKPKWLIPNGLPSVDRMLCAQCQNPLILLLQIYLPVRLELSPNAYHRMLYMFVCTNDDCHQIGADPAIKVFRCQLPKMNQYYLPNADDDKDSSDVVQPGCVAPPTLCVVCGCHAPKSCSRCHQMKYCSRLHQIHDWKSGHNAICQKEPKEPLKTNKMAASLLLKEFDIVTEKESLNRVEETAKSDAELMEDYQKYIRSPKYKKECVSGAEKLSNGDIGGEVDTEVKDKIYNEFRKLMSVEPDQVLRIISEPGVEPVWVTSKGRLEACSDIPRCSCGSERAFEFQVMPQLLYYLKLDVLGQSSLDWGTLVVYTCKDHCLQKEKQYMEEYCWKQDFS